LAARGVRAEAGVVYGPGGEIDCETRAATAYSRISWDGARFSVLDGKEDHPMVCVRWHGATAYTNC
jgi:formylglycine-generating enzyme required for sulfatase activity